MYLLSHRSAWIWGTSKTPTYFLGKSHGFNSVHGRMPSVLRLRKLAVDYDPYDHISALSYLQQRHAMGEIVTGLLFVEPDSGDMHEFLDTVKTPLIRLGEPSSVPVPNSSPASTPRTGSG